MQEKKENNSLNTLGSVWKQKSEWPLFFIFSYKKKVEKKRSGIGNTFGNMIPVIALLNIFGNR